MSFTHRIRQIYTQGSSQVGDNTLSYTGDGEQNFNGSLTAGGTREVDIAIDKDTLKALFMFADRAVTVYTNANTPSQDNTIVLAAGVPLMWSADTGGANPIAAADVTKLYVVCASGAATNFKVVSLNDVTP